MPRTLEPSTIVDPVVADEDIDAFFEYEDLWAVIVWNDDVTTFQTVIQAFVEIFGHTVERADKLAWQIHRTGKAVAAVRPKDEAEAAVHALHLRKISASLSRAYVLRDDPDPGRLLGTPASESGRSVRDVVSFHAPRHVTRRPSRWTPHSYCVYALSIHSK